MIRVGIGQSSHRFLSEDVAKPCIIGGLLFEGIPGLDATSDGDIVFHAICNGITSICGAPILNGIVTELYAKDGITDSAIYVEKGLEKMMPYRIQHVALSIEAKRPLMQPRILEMRQKIATTLHLDVNQVGLTVTYADGLTDVSCGDGVRCYCILTVA